MPPIMALKSLLTALKNTATDIKKQDEIWGQVKNPLISEQPDGTCNLTFLYRGDSTTQNLSLCSAIIDPYMSGEPFHKIDDTDIWHLTVKNVPNDARITYLCLEKEWGGLLNLSSDFNEKEPQYKDVCSLFDSPVCTILCRDALYYADKDANKENERFKKIVLPEDTTIAGFSMGGNTATQIGTRPSERFGNVISQSGAFWMGGPDPVSGNFKPTEGLLTKLEHQNYANNPEYPNNEHAKNSAFI